MQQTQITKRNSSKVKKPGPAGEKIALFRPVDNFPDSLTMWMNAYFDYEATTTRTSRQVQQRDIKLFIGFLVREAGDDSRERWTPRFSQAFIEFLRSTLDEKTGRRRWGDRTINRILAHLKTFAKWVHRWRSFPLGNPMEKIRMNTLAAGLEIERALTPAEIRRILDAADRLSIDAGRSKDRKRYRKMKERPMRKGARPYRDRAIVYTLVNTGMRRGGICSMTIENISFKEKSIRTLEKGGIEHTYAINRQGLAALKDYLERERPGDNERWQSNQVFLSEKSRSTGKGLLTPQTINKIWNQVAAIAGVDGKSPHSCRHAMGKLIMDKTGNVAAVQRQLGHRNAQYSLQYSRITRKELDQVLETIDDPLHDRKKNG